MKKKTVYKYRFRMSHWNVFFFNPSEPSKKLFFKKFGRCHLFLLAPGKKPSSCMLIVCKHFFKLMSNPGCPVVTIPSWLSCPFNPVLAVLSWHLRFQQNIFIGNCHTAIIFFFAYRTLVQRNNLFSEAFLVAWQFSPENLYRMPTAIRGKIILIIIPLED
jgi:hypothetical protein